MYGYSCMTSEVGLRNQARGQSNTNEASLDTMWKIIQQKADIVGKFTGDTKDIYKDIVQGRSGGMLFKTVQELQGQPLSDATFKDLMSSVEGERKRFLRDQKQLQDYIQTRQSMLDNGLQRFFITMFGGKTTEFKKKGDPKTPEDWAEDFLYTWVTSAATQEMVRTGQENNVKLFPKEEKKPAVEKDDKK